MRLQLVIALLLIGCLLAAAAPKKRDRKEKKEERRRENERESNDNDDEADDDDDDDDDDETTAEPEGATTEESASRREQKKAEKEAKKAERTENKAEKKEGKEGKKEEKEAKKEGKAAEKEEKKAAKEAKQEERRRLRKERRKKPPQENKPPKRKEYNKEERMRLRQSCKKNKGAEGCKKQSEKATKRKEKVKTLRVKDRVKRRERRGENVTEEEKVEIEQQIQRQIDKTFEAKQAFIKMQGLDVEEDNETSIVANDDGVWAGDIFLTESQAEMVIRAFNKTIDGNDTDDFSNEIPDPPPLPGDVLDDDQDDSEPEPTVGAEIPQGVDPAIIIERKKRYALFLEENLGARWDSMPIKYMFDPGFSEEEQAVVSRAMEDISSKTCVSFEQIETTDFIEPYIIFQREDYADFCGLTYLGRTDVENPIWLNFAECREQMIGTVIHNVLHVLGIEHTQARYDRNMYLYIDFDNVDPQALDFYAEADRNSFNSYGVQYDYFSVMHFGSYSAALDPSKYVMYAAVEPRETFNKIMGQRLALSDRDAQMVRKMYCLPADCLDTHAWCGWWATVGYCLTDGQMMLDLCPKSCSFCPYEAYERAKIAEAGENQPLPS